MVLTPQAPGSGTCSFFNLSPSTYALLPAFASKSLVAIAAPPAAFFAVEKLNPELRNVSTNADRGSTRVREGGRARVYVYNLVRAELSAWPHTCGVTLPLFNALAWRPCAKAEKKILESYEGPFFHTCLFRDKLLRIESTAGTAHCFFCDLGDGNDRIDQITIPYFTTINLCQHTCVSIVRSLSFQFKVPYTFGTCLLMSIISTMSKVQKIAYVNLPST